jgi:hypothetical protein
MGFTQSERRRYRFQRGIRTAVTATLVLFAGVASATDGAATFTTNPPARTLFDFELHGCLLAGQLDSVGDPGGALGGPGSGEVRLERIDGVWSGWLATALIAEARAEVDEKDRVAVEVVGPKIGQRRYFVTTTADGTVETRQAFPLRDEQVRTHPVGRLLADGRRLVVGNRIELGSRDGRRYEGRGAGLSDAVLTAEGALAPAVLAREDPALYVLLYFVAARQ